MSSMSLQNSTQKKQQQKSKQKYNS